MKSYFEPFKIKAIEEIPITTRIDREKFIKEANYNPFNLRSDYITIDLLTDSGTSAMSSKQWAAIMDGDESYAGSRNWFEFENEVKKITGFKHIIPAHQGRAAERILFSVVAGPGKVVPNNTHFDTTRGNLEYTNAVAVDLPVPESDDTTVIAPFKGNMDLNALENLILEKGKENIPLCIITITNNSGGGQPVSMENIKQTKKLLKKYNIPLYLDCCRFAENAYFIKKREKGYENKTILEIAQEMFSYADGATMSAKKDGLSNIGGFVATNDDKVAEGLKTNLIVTEGFITYGGLARRDLAALAQGFREVVNENYLTYRIEQVNNLGQLLKENGVPILEPVGGHGVYLDAKRFAPHIKQEYFPGQSIACEIYKESGVRCCEIGSVMFGTYDNDGNFIAPKLELVRLAIPRRVYTNDHLRYVAESVINVYNNREQLRGMKITWQPEFLRHFTAKFDYI